LTVEIPSDIPRQLNPNASRYQHWGDRVRAEGHLALATTLGLRTARPQGYGDPGPIFLPPITWDLAIFWGKGKKRWDPDNVVAGLKRGVIDAVARTIGVDDKHFAVGEITQGRDPEGLGRMVLTLRGGRNEGAA